MQTTSEFSAESIAWYVGIDISKAWLDVHLRPTGRALQCDNTAEGFTELDRWLRHQGARCFITDFTLKGVQQKQLG